MVRVWRKSEWIESRFKDVEMLPLAWDEGCLLSLFRFKPGAVVPVHNHPEAQYGVVLEGRGVFMDDEGRETRVEEGDSYAIKSNERHGFKALTDVIVLDIFVPAREDYKKFAREPDHPGPP